jgi:aspartokinase
MISEHMITVKKFGGSSVATPEKIKAVAGFLKTALDQGERILVVVSAMGQTTNDLLKLSQEIAKNPIKRELDMLLSCGERASMALLAMALQEIGVLAISLTGSQSGIITDNVHAGAQIQAIRPHRVMDAFIEHQVVIIAGFQGMSLQKEVTTLRRGGSDTTAVAMAAALNASRCEIYTDVPGVMTADPNIIDSAVLLPTVTFNELCQMSLFGAKVMAHDAARLAKMWGVNLIVAQTGATEVHTAVLEFSLVKEQNAVTAITHCAELVRFAMPLSDFLSLNLPLPNIVGFSAVGAEASGFVPKSWSADPRFISSIDSPILALVAIHAEALDWQTVLKTAVSCLKVHNIAISSMQTAGTMMSLMVANTDLPAALRVLHEALITAPRDISPDAVHEKAWDQICC